MSLGDGILWSTVLILLSGCGSKEVPPVAAVSNKEAAPIIDSECFQRTLKLEIQGAEHSMAQFSTASENGTLREYLAASNVREAVFDLDICRRYSRCYDITEEERLGQVMRCTDQRLLERIKDMVY